MNAGNPINVAPVANLPFNIPDAPFIPIMVDPIMVGLIFVHMLHVIHFHIFQIHQDARQRQRQENLRNWNWEEVIDVDIIPDEEVISDEEVILDEEVMDVDMIPDEEVMDVDMILDEEDAHVLDLEELFGLRLADEDIMPNPVGPNNHVRNINAQRENVVQVLNRHRLYSIRDEIDLMDETEDFDDEE